MGYDQHAVPDNAAVEHMFVAFLYVVRALACHSF